MNATVNIPEARNNMTHHQVKPWAILDQRVLAALDSVAREKFVPAGMEALAYADIEIPLSAVAGQCLLHPGLTARMLQALNVQPHERVLEIGTGSGYGAALLSTLGQDVVSVEIDAALAAQARSRLATLGYHHVDVFHGDGSTQGPWLERGPFDVIVLSGSVAAVPEDLLKLLTPTGRLAAVVGQLPMMRCHVVSANGSTLQPFDTVAPRLLGFAEAPRFVF